MPTTAADKDQLSVLILDSNKWLSETIADSFSRNGGLFVSCSVREGTRAIELLDLHKPDVLLMDIVLPLKDGFSVLEDIQKNDVMKDGTIIVSSSMGNDLAMRRSIELGADYFLLKPYDVDILIKRIIEIHSEKKATEHSYVPEEGTKTSQRNVKQLISEFLFKSGIESNVKGYDYLNRAISICFCDENALYGLTKHIYPAIGKEAGCDVTSVERAMRYAIHTSWKKGIMQPFFKEIGYDAVGSRRPTTGNYLKLALRTIKSNKNF